MLERPGVYAYGLGYRACITVATPTYRTAEEAEAARNELKDRLARVKLLRREPHRVEPDHLVSPYDAPRLPNKEGL
jgi:hypothetical protein